MWYHSWGQVKRAVDGWERDLQERPEVCERGGIPLSPFLRDGPEGQGSAEPLGAPVRHADQRGGQRVRLNGGLPRAGANQ